MMMRAVCTIEIGNLLRIIELRGDNGRYGRLSEPDIFGVDVGFGLVLEQTVVRYGHFQRDGIDLVSVELQRLPSGLIVRALYDTDRNSIVGIPST